MRILVYGINFAPEQTGIGRYTGEMASWLAEQGHDVRAVTAPPYYPSWKLAPDYRKQPGGREVWRKVRVWRCPIWLPKELSGFTRLMHLLSFAIGSLPALISQIVWRPQLVFVVAPAFVCAPAGWVVARLSGAAAWLHIQDFEVDAAYRLGLLPEGRMQKVAVGLERWLLRRFERVSTISNRMLERLALKGVSKERSVLFPNWVDVSAISPAQGGGSYRKELGIAEDAVVALYSGSMAAKQGLHLLSAAARVLESTFPKIVFVLCGDGVIKTSLEFACAGLANVRFLPLQPSERLGELLSFADVHLLPQSEQAADLVMPSKLTGMLASGRPVVTTARPETELARTVEGCGLVVPPGDLGALVSALEQLCVDEVMRKRLGAAARAHAEKYLARDQVLTRLQGDLEKCVGPTSFAAQPPVPAPASGQVKSPLAAARESFTKRGTP